MNKSPQKSSGNKKSSKQIAVTATQAEFYEGPLPHPDILARYEKISPGFSERILQQFELNSNHVRQCEAITVADDLKTRKRGQIMAFILAVIVLSIGGMLVYYDHGIIGTIFSGPGLVLILKIFLTGS